MHINYAFFMHLWPAALCLPTMTIRINASAIAARIAPDFLSFGMETWSSMGGFGPPPNYSDPRLRLLASHLSPATVRIGGITADWLFYDTTPGAVSAAAASGVEADVRETGFWPTAEKNLTLAAFQAYLSFFDAAGLNFMFDLNELHGRDCQGPNGRCTPGQPWDESNAAAFFGAIRGLVGGPSPLFRQK